MILFHFSFYSIVCATFLLLYLYRNNEDAKVGISFYTLITVIWLWATLSFREPTGDFWRYMQALELISQMSFHELLDHESPIGFKLLNWTISRFSNNSIVFFSTTFLFCIIPIYQAFRERTNKVDSSALMMLYLLYPFYINYLSSGIKQGIAFGFMLWGFNCIIDNTNPKWIKGIVFLLIATTFHTSFWLAVLVFLIWFLLYRRVPLSWSIGSLLTTIVLAAIGFTESITAFVLPDDIVENLGFDLYFDKDFIESDEFQSVGYKSGFRVDFTVFTLLPLIYLWFLKRQVNNYVLLADIIKIYSLLASTYFLLVFIPYSDRVASFSWFLIPFMIFTHVSNLYTHKYKNIFMITSIALYPILMLTYTQGYFK